MLHATETVALTVCGDEDATVDVCGVIRKDHLGNEYVREIKLASKTEVVRIRTANDSREER